MAGPWIGRFFLLVFFLLTPNGWAQTPSTVEEVFKFAGEKAAGYTDWSADFIQTASIPTGQFQQKGHLAMKRPHQIWMLMSMDIADQSSTNLVIAGADGIAWTEMNAMGQKQVMKMDLNAMAGSGQNPARNADPIEQVRRYQDLFDFQLKESREQNGQMMFVLEGVKKSTTANADPQLAVLLAGSSKLRAFIGKQDGFVHQIEMLDKDGKLLFSQEFRNLKVNQALSDEMFHYSPPPGVRIMDMTVSNARSQTNTAPAATEPNSPEAKP